MLINKHHSLAAKAKNIKKTLAISAFSLTLLAAALSATTNKAHATATILMPGQITQIAGQVNVFKEYATMIEQWTNNISSFLSEYGLDEWIQVRIGFHHTRNNELYYGERTAVRLMMGQVDPNSGIANRVGHHNRALLGIVVDGAGKFNNDVIERILPPPQPPISGELSDDDINAIRDHARLLAMETYTEPAPARDLDTSYAMEYELARISYIQQQLLAQDSIKQYPMHAGLIKGQADKALTITKAAEDDSTNAATLLSLQVLAQSELNGNTSLAILESSLRQERILGALLAIKAKDQHLDNIDALNRAEFP